MRSWQPFGWASFSPATCDRRFHCGFFYCFRARLVVEVDGEIHDFQREADKMRESVLISRGLRAIRFSNWKAIQQFDEVLEEIGAVCEEQETSLPPR
jgi:very-short-patch-repair endonuclease